MVAHAIPPKYVKPPQKYIKSEFSLDGDTTNKTDFQQWPSCKRESMKPNETYTSTGKLQGISETADEFVDHGLQPVYRRPLPQYSPSNFNTFPANEQQDRAIPPNQAKPQEIVQVIVKPEIMGPMPDNITVGGEEFVGESENKEQFVQHTLPERFHIPKREYAPNQEVFQGETTQAADYKAIPVPKSRLEGLTPPISRSEANWRETLSTMTNSSNSLFQNSSANRKNATFQARKSLAGKAAPR